VTLILLNPPRASHRSFLGVGAFSSGHGVAKGGAQPRSDAGAVCMVFLVSVVILRHNLHLPEKLLTAYLHSHRFYPNLPHRYSTTSPHQPAYFFFGQLFSLLVNDTGVYSKATNSTAERQSGVTLVVRALFGYLLEESCRPRLSSQSQYQRPTRVRKNPTPPAPATIRIAASRLPPLPRSLTYFCT